MTLLLARERLNKEQKKKKQKCVQSDFDGTLNNNNDGLSAIDL